jgi:hypothetical protein
MLKHFEICGQRFELYGPDKGRIEQSVIDRCLWAKAKDVAKRRDVAALDLNSAIVPCLAPIIS